MVSKKSLTPFILVPISIVLVYVLEFQLVLNTMINLQLTSLNLGLLLALLDASLNPTDLLFFILRWVVIGFITGILVRHSFYNLLSSILTGLLTGTIFVGVILLEPTSFWYTLDYVQWIQFVFPRWALGAVGGFVGGIVGILIGMIETRRAKKIALTPTDIPPLKLKCPHCSYTMASSAKYCGKCGKPVSGE